MPGMMALSHPRVDITLSIVSIVAGALLGQLIYGFLRGAGLFVANYPCGSYIDPYSCVMLDPRIQIVFSVGGAFTGFLFYFVNVMHQRIVALRMGLMIGFGALLTGSIWILTGWETDYFSGTMFGFTSLALLAFLAFDGLLYSRGKAELSPSPTKVS